MFFHESGVFCISEVIDISPTNRDSACVSFSWAFHMMYSAYNLNKQGDNIQPLIAPFLIWNLSAVPCSVLLLSGIPISVSFPQFVVIHTVKGFYMVNKAEVGIFLEFCCFFYDPTDDGNLISGPSAFSKSSLNI